MARYYIHGVKASRGFRHYKAVLLILLIVIIAGAVFLDKKYHQADKPVESTSNTQNQPSIGYITPYFSFYDTAKWLKSSQDSSTNQVTYNHYEDGVLLQQLTVYVDASPSASTLAATHTLPVTVVSGDSLSPGSVSGPCAQALPAGQTHVSEITFQGATIPCDPGPDNYSVLLTSGQKYTIKMQHNHVDTNYILIFKDFSTKPNTDSLLRIANSFKSA